MEKLAESYFYEPLDVDVALLGVYYFKLDDKNRLRIPSAFQEGLGKNATITIDIEGRLRIMPYECYIHYKNYLNRICAKANDKILDAYLRYFYKNSLLIKEDTQSRFILPEDLKKQANINKDVTLFGRGSFVEIWSSEAWEKYQCEMNNVTSFAEDLKSKYGIH